MSAATPDRRSEYEGLSHQQLVARLKAAEDVCILYGWSVPQVCDCVHIDANDAVLQLWMMWAHMVPDFVTDPAANEELEAMRPGLAAERKVIRAATLAKIRSAAAPPPTPSPDRKEEP